MILVSICISLVFVMNTTNLTSEEMLSGAMLRQDLVCTLCALCSNFIRIHV